MQTWRACILSGGMESSYMSLTSVGLVQLAGLCLPVKEKLLPLKPACQKDTVYRRTEASMSASQEKLLPLKPDCQKGTLCLWGVGSKTNQTLVLLRCFKTQNILEYRFQSAE